MSIFAEYGAFKQALCRITEAFQHFHICPKIPFPRDTAIIIQLFRYLQRNIIS